MRFLLLFSCLFLVGCMDQNQADTKMATGCLAGLNALLKDQGKEISEVQMQQYANEEIEGRLYRRITIAGIEKEGWLELDKEYSCLFDQQWGLFKSSHRASLMQVQMDERTVGQRDGKIEGTFEDFQKLNKAISAVMEQ